MPVLDASVVIDWVRPNPDPAGPAHQLLRRMAAAGVSLHGPHLLIQESANALLTGVRRQRWTSAEADVAFGTLDMLPLVRHASNNDLERAWELARRFDEHPFYDMVYVALAERLGDVLVTADVRLRDRIRRPELVIGPEEWVA